LSKKVVVVFRIPDGNGVVPRETKRMQRVSQAGAFADGLWQHHEAAAVEEDCERQLQLSDGRENCGCNCGISFHDALARRECNSAAPQFIEEDSRRRLTNDSRLTVGKRDDRAIFGYYAIDEIELSRDIPQVGQHSTSYDEDNDAMGAGFGDGPLHVGG
jgi:hypothetical protein